MKTIALLLLFALNGSLAHADAKSYFFYRHNGIAASHHVFVVDGQVDNAEQWFDQTLDHFDAQNKTTFKQRFYVASRFVKPGTAATAPVILYLCGEGACTGGADQSPAAASYAQTYGATMIAIEHRYYGKSFPFRDLTTENLKYLSTAQAIEDVAAFARYAKTTLGLQGKYIVIGGSYAGALSAFVRLKHPELIDASLASSGPVEARAAFTDYDRSVAVGLGADCLAKVLKVTHDAEAVIQDPAAFDKAKTLFNVQPITDPVDFLYVIADMAAGAVQYGMQTGFCAQLGDQPTLETFQAAGQGVDDQLGMKAMDSSFKEAENTDATSYQDSVGMRQWTYQTCTEYGYFQVNSGDPTQTARSTKIDVPYHLAACKTLFGDSVSLNTDATNAMYYQDLLKPEKASQIFFTNGGMDPWAKLSITTDRGNAATNPAVKALTIDGASHCADLGWGSAEPLVAARNAISTWLGTFLSPAKILP